VRTSLLLSAALVAALALGPSASAQTAPDPQAIEEAKQHFAKGKELFEAGDKKGAVEEFKQAYKLSRNPLLLYNIGFVYDDIRDRALAVHFYEKFLTDAPDNEKTRDNRALSAERVKALKKEIADEDARANANPDPDPNPDGGNGNPNPDGGNTNPDPDDGRKPPPKPRVTEFAHSVVEDAPPGKPLDIIAVIPDEASWKLTLFYRAAGEDDFKTAKMRPRYTEIVGRIPPEAVKGNSVQYYIEVKDKGGKLVASSGRASSPNVVFLDAGAKPHYYEDLSEGGSGSFAGGDGGEGGGGGVGGGGGGGGGGRDPRSKTWTYAKWATTGGAVTFLGAALGLYLAAKNSATTIEGEAVKSHPSSDMCAGGSPPPCTSFGTYQKNLQSAGRSYETWTNVTLILGVGSAIAAGTIWYLDIKRASRAEQRAAGPRVRVVAAPVVGEGYVGGAALVEF